MNNKLTVEDTFLARSLNSGDSLFFNSCLYVCCTLNSNITLGFCGGAGVVVVVVAAVVVVVGLVDGIVDDKVAMVGAEVWLTGDRVHSGVSLNVGEVVPVCCVVTKQDKKILKLLLNTMYFS